jgi:hypothetical protein
VGAITLIRSGSAQPRGANADERSGGSRPNTTDTCRRKTALKRAGGIIRVEEAVLLAAAARGVPAPRWRPCPEA